MRPGDVQNAWDRHEPLNPSRTTTRGASPLMASIGRAQVQRTRVVSYTGSASDSDGELGDRLHGAELLPLGLYQQSATAGGALTTPNPGGQLMAAR